MEVDPRILSRLELRSEEVMKRWGVKRAASEVKKRAGRPKKAVTSVERVPLLPMGIVQ